MPRVVQTLDNQNQTPPAGKMQFTPSKPMSSFKSPRACSTPESSGTFLAARTSSNFDYTKNKNKENKVQSNLNYKDALLKEKPSPGGLAEAVADVQLKRASGGHGQAKHCESQKMSTNSFYGPSSSQQWNSQITVKERSKNANTPEATKKELVAKINRRSKMNPPDPGYHDRDLIWHTGRTPPHKVISASADLNLSNNTATAKVSKPPDQASDSETEMVSCSRQVPGTNTPLPSSTSLNKLLPHKIGLKNHGNTCYINACMQSMLGLELLVTDIMNVRNFLDIEESTQGLVGSFSKLCMDYTRGERGWVDQGIKEVKVVMEILHKQFSGSKMQDASEFLGLFLDEMKEDVTRLSRSIKVGRSNLSPELNCLVYDNFLHEKEELLVCSSCKAETRCRYNDMSMWCDTTCSNHQSRTRSVSIQTLFEQSLAKETRMRRCDECGGEEATVISKMVRLPRVLIIFLKRYKYSDQDIAGKVSRQVSIPDTLCLSSVVSDTVTLPDTSLPDLLSPLQTPDDSVPGTPVTSLPPAQLDTPTKFKGLSDEQLGLLGEEDQMEYTMLLSEKEAFEGEMKGEDIDEDLKAALEASMRDDTFSEILTMAGETGQEEDCRTPSRKRNYGQLTGGEEWHSGAGDGQGGNYAQGHSRQEETTTSYSKVVKSSNFSFAGDRQDISSLRPVSREQEEADLSRALELSTQEASSADNFGYQMDLDVDMEDDVENNNNMAEMVVSDCGMPEHTFQLHSVVSHYGTSASAGHYVADVFRFDGGGWFRYDDTRVTKTDSVTVRTGPNCSNGYILTYLYQPLWEKCRAKQE